MGVDLRSLDPARPRAGASPWLWFLALVPPLAWFLHLNVSYLLVPLACRVGHPWWLVAASIPPLVAIALTSWLSWRAWHADERSDTDRTAGVTGVALGALFGLVSLTILLANVVVDPCRA
jgi:hypothetical protein